MMLQGLFFVLLALTGQIQSKSDPLPSVYALDIPLTNFLLSIKEQLKTGVLSVQGNQWPLMLYASYKHDKENPWKGLLRSSILVKVCH